MVSLKFSEKSWIIETVLEHENDEDSEEMNDVADDLLTYIEGVRDQISDASYKKVTSVCMVSKEDLLIKHVENCRVVFKRKEPTFNIS